MEKLKEFVMKNRVWLTIILLLIASFFIYLFVFADEDIYENQIEVTNTAVNIIDGTANVNGNFDPNDEAGNDSSASNKIVRNFDDLTYEISYKLSYKSDSTLSDEDKTTDLTRNVIVDVLIPTDLSVAVADSDPMVTLTKEFVVNSDGRTYNYYKIVKNDARMSETNTVDIVLTKINGKNDDVIAPIIRVRESTDNTNDKNITENTQVSGINKINIQDVRISAKEKYSIYLYQGMKKPLDDENINSEMPVGMIIYLPNDANKGIKGIQVPNEVSFNLNIASSTNDSQSQILENSKILNYKSDIGYTVADLPEAYDQNNGTSTIETESLNQNSNSNYTIKFTDLRYNSNTRLTQLSENNDVYYLSSKVFVFKNQRASGYKGDISYDITTNVPGSNSIEDYLSNYVPFIGDYTTKIDFFNRSTSSDATISFVDSGKAIYNYNEEFYIQNTINYGLKKGDKLSDGFTNYIKIDNDAFMLENIGNASDESKDYYVQFDNNTDGNLDYSVSYGLGEWNLSYFNVKSQAPSYCPTSTQLSSMDAVTLKENLMNLYGGPCIEATNVQWVDTLQDARDNHKENKVILFRFNMLDEYSTGIQTVIRLKAKAVKNYNNIGKTFQIVSRGETIKGGKPYYLSEIPKVSVENQNADLNYVKTSYSADHNAVTLHKSYANGEEVTTPIGNTVLISPLKVSINSIELHDIYDSVGKTTFYSGLTDPIEFIINPVIYKSDFDSVISGATITVYLPESLEIYVKTGDKAYNSATSGQVVTIDGVNYKQYNYDYSDEDINYENESASGTIPNLKIHAYIAISTPDRTNTQVISTITGQLKPNVLDTVTYNDVTPQSQKQNSVNITLRNTRDISTIGTPNVTRIDQNGTYTYNMRAANSSNTPADLSMLYILPYSGDGIGEGSKFSGNVSVSIAGSLPTGYSAFYTSDNAKTLLNNEINDIPTVNWTAWSNINTAKNNITAIKIVAPSQIQPANYFGTPQGITLNVVTNGNKEAEKYYNNFYMVQKNADVCVFDDINTECSRTEKKTMPYSSNVSQVSVYDRIISGYAFEDDNYNGFYDKEELMLQDVIVDLYKLKATSFDPKKPTEAISVEDEKINEGKGLTDKNGYYKFDNLKAGNYYVKYMFDCNKYTTTEKNKVDTSVIGDASVIDSDAQIVEIKDDESGKTTCYAVSNILTLNNDKVEHNHIDLGLRIRQDFDVKVAKYITKVVVNSNMGSQTYNYNNQTKVKVDVKNLKNTSFRVTYGMEIENTKYFPGTIGNIIESIPAGMTFDPNLPENEGWYENNGSLYYTGFNKTLIMPGEKYHITIVLDLVTDTGGDYINIVAVNNLKIKPVITNFLEVPEPTTPEDNETQKGEGE